MATAPVTSLWLVSLGTVTDGVTPFTLKSDKLFQMSSSKLDDLILVIVTTPTLSTFPGDRLSSVLVNSATKKLYFH